MRMYDEFARAVTDKVLSATKQEKAAIRRELLEHLEDHAAYLAETGLSADEAAAEALAAMGDPEEIGRKMNEKYPKWPGILTFCLQMLVLALAAYLILFIPRYLDPPKDNLTARFAPETSRHDVSEKYKRGEAVDYRWTLNGQVFYVYRLDRTETVREIFETPQMVNLSVCTYAQNPFGLCARNSIDSLFFTDSTGERLYAFRPQGGGSGYAAYNFYQIAIGEEDTSVFVCYGNKNSGFSVEIPLPEEVTP